MSDLSFETHHVLHIQFRAVVHEALHDVEVSLHRSKHHGSGVALSLVNRRIIFDCHTVRTEALYLALGIDICAGI